ncbi:MAG: alpha/beta hydrolase [Deltaproteobacteria bacterium]|nr:alpha/beta hydrolase [Deltaproteobacteria bacterium]
MSTKQLGFIHTFIPPKDPKSPITLLLLHGTGGNESSLLSLGRSLAPGCALLGPRGQVLENGMPRFFRRFAEGVFDIEDLVFRTNELADFVEDASNVYKFDLTKLIAVGYSNGANIAASVLLLRPELLDGAVLFRPMVPLVPEKTPNISGTSVLISAGKLDPIVPQEETERLATLLRECASDVTVNLQDRGHELSSEEIKYAKEWLSKQITRSQ